MWGLGEDLVVSYLNLLLPLQMNSITLSWAVVDCALSNSEPKTDPFYFKLLCQKFRHSNNKCYMRCGPRVLWLSL